MGFVYRAYHAQLERTGAVKVMQAIAPDPDTVARFRHEAQAIAQMRHPNVLLTAEDSPVLADFGLAKLLQGSSLKSMTGVTTGTPAYMAPEQVTGSKVGPAADRYSLATIAYEMLTGVIPFDGEALMELLY